MTSSALPPLLIAAGAFAALATVVSILFLKTRASLRTAERQVSANSETLSRLLENITRLQAAIEEQRKSSSEEIKILHQALQASLSTSDQRLTAGLQETRNAILGVTGKLAALDQAGKDLKEAVNRLSELRRLLAAPGSRGSLGERMMEQWILDVLPSKYVLTQHEIPGSGRVDLAVKVGSRIIPIDSKFPYDTFSRLASAESDEALKSARKELAANLRKRIDEVAKYVNPARGTYPFALMFIPSESAFIEAVRNQDVLSRALDKKVIPVGPSTFLAYLEVIHEGLRGFEVEETTRAILGQLDDLSSLAGKTEQALALHEKHMRNAANTLTNIRHNLSLLSSAVDKLQSVGSPQREDAPASPPPE